MPYINGWDRAKFASVLAALGDVVKAEGLSNGELNYLMTSLGLIYLDRHGRSYDTISGVVKALECAKLEFYRRVAVPYEDTKIKVNGDVYVA